MCDSTKSHSHAHGMRTEVDKALADLREDLIEELRLVTKYEAHLRLIGAASFPQVDEVIEVLGRLREDARRHTEDLIHIITHLEGQPAGPGALLGTPGGRLGSNEPAHDHEL